MCVRACVRVCVCVRVRVCVCVRARGKGWAGMGVCGVGAGSYSSGEIHPPALVMKGVHRDNPLTHTHPCSGNKKVQSHNPRECPNFFEKAQVLWPHPYPNANPHPNPPRCT